MSTKPPPQRDWPPGVPAPQTGLYAEINVLGTPTGLRIGVNEGMDLPAAPRGFVWRLVETEPPR